MTGEEGIIIAVRSSDTRLCTVSGYPAITFDHGTQRIPFTYTDGAGPYVTHEQPTSVTLGPDKIAYFLVAKYRCDTGDAEEADGATVRLTPQGRADTVPAAWLRGLIALCNPTSPAGVGNTVSLSPLEPALTRLGNVTT